jgi:phospholipid transport system substrate-binding protein
MLAVITASAPLGVLSSPAYAQAASAQSAGQFVDQLADKAFAVLRDKSLSREEARRQFRVMLKQNVAVKQVGDRLIRSVRSQVTPQQYNSYMAAFPDYVVGTYADRLYDYANADLTIVRVQPVGSGFAVFSRVTQPGQGRPFEAVWSVVNVNGKFQITNLTVAGVNLALTQEADFRSVIQRNGFDALVRFMEAKKG